MPRVCMWKVCLNYMQLQAGLAAGTGALRITPSSGKLISDISPENVV